MGRSVINSALVLLLLTMLSGGNAFAMFGQKSDAPAPDSTWIPVPAWLAGTWQARFQTFLDTYDCRSGRHSLEQPTTLQISRQRTIGAQQDETGQIWHYAATPYVRNVETDSYLESQRIERLTVLSSDNNQVKLCTVGKVTRRSKTTEEMDSFDERTVVTYAPLNDGVIKVDMTITDSIEGQELSRSSSVCVERRVKPFVVVNFDERGDLRDKFLRFMAERNWRSAPMDRPVAAPSNAGAQ